MSDQHQPAPLDRVSSHVPGLDTILDGGFFGSGVYMIHGLPGCGKTIFANQLCFGHVAAGGRALYVTLLAESHARLLQHLRPMSFFDESVIPGKLAYISAFAELEGDGLKGLTAVLRREMRDHGASLLVLDGLVNASETATSSRELKKFIHEIQTNASFHGCTVFLLTSGLQQSVHAEHTMVDGLIELEDRLFDYRSERLIQIRKFRGAQALRGKHAFQITGDGIRIYPRLESLYKKVVTRSDGPAPESALSTGVPTLDALFMRGGLPQASATVIVGSTGTGKTSLGLHFLGCSSAAEPGLLYSFFETPDRTLSVARSMSIDLETLHRDGVLSIAWHEMGEHILDQLGHRLLDLVRARGIKRLMIDGLSGFFESATFPERIGRFMACLLSELRELGVTVLMALETTDVVTSAVPLPYGVSALIDNLIFFRFVEDEGGIERLISLIKVRGTAFDGGVHRFDITAAGMAINGKYTGGGDVIPSAHAVADKSRRPSKG